MNSSANRVGDELSFTLTLASAGTGPATNVVVRDRLPPGLNLLSTTTAGFVITADAPPVGTAFNRAKAEWTIPRLANGGSITLRLDTSTAQIGAGINRAIVSAATADPVPGNNAAAAPIQVVGASFCGVARLCSSTNTPNIDAEVTLTQAGKSFRARTDRQGRFCIDNLIPGKYKLQIAGNVETGIQSIEVDPVDVNASPNVRLFAP